MLTAELFEKHDRGRFEIVGYSYGRDDGSPIRRRIVNALDRFVDVSDRSFGEMAERIAAEEVDILVDLTGYTMDARPQCLALRPAPIQVNYLGYPGTMGASFIDYILVDDFIVPSELQPFFAEKLVYLPGCYQANDSRREISTHAPSRGECGLPETGFVFCCFNNSYKITPDVFCAHEVLAARHPRQRGLVVGGQSCHRRQPAQGGPSSWNRARAAGIRAASRFGRTPGSASPGRFVS